MKEIAENSPLGDHPIEDPEAEGASNGRLELSFGLCRCHQPLHQKPLLLGIGKEGTLPAGLLDAVELYFWFG